MTENNNEKNFGAQLAEARKKLGLTPQEIANQLNLKLTTIECIDSSDVENLPTPSFTRGYIRSYAKLVKVDSEPLISLYNEVSPGDPELVYASALVPQAQSDHLLIRWTSVVITIVILALLGFWMFGSENGNVNSAQYNAVKNPDPNPEQIASEGEAARTLNSQNQRSPEQTDEFSQQKISEPEDIKNIQPQPTAASLPITSFADVEQSADAERQTEITVDAVTETEGERVNEQSASIELLNDRATDNDADATFTNSDSLETILPETPPDSVDSLTHPIATSASDNNREIIGNDILRITTSTETWVEIVDANGVKLMYGMLSGNNERIMTGTAPFQIFLGNAPDVRIFVNGTKTATPAYNAISKTSRFSVDANGAFIRP